MNVEETIAAVKGHINRPFIAECDACGWESTWETNEVDAQEALDNHVIEIHDAEDEPF